MPSAEILWSRKSRKETQNSQLSSFAYKPAKNFSKMFIVRVKIGKNNYIINITEYELAYNIFEDLINKVLKDSRCIFETEWHY